MNKTENKEFLQKITILENGSINDAINSLEDTQAKIVVILDKDNKFKGIVCDGDIRRGILKGLDLSSNILNIMEDSAFIVGPEINTQTVKGLMELNKIQQIPIVDNKGYLVGLHSWDDIFATKKRENFLIIMAGGRGKRMLSETDECPKPMLLIQGKPMLEHIIERAKIEGFVNFIISTNYLGSIIKQHFGDGEKMGVNIDYISEDSPLGTAGALSLLNPSPELPFIVTNGDVITNICYGEMLDYHEENEAIATMAIRPYEWQNPFGVVELDGIEILGCNEKPIIRNNINAGVYALNPHALNYLEPNVHCDMTTLFKKINEKNNKVIAYPIHETWLDVGRPDDLKLANKED
ncbi:nucleotidyltransferase family protein [Gammaproteobacteria bacterium]|nr:nucleotidyltransferase family protein [Gammaproteobacteria bacterium]